MDPGKYAEEQQEDVHDTYQNKSDMSHLDHHVKSNPPTKFGRINPSELKQRPTRKALGLLIFVKNTMEKYFMQISNALTYIVDNSIHNSLCNPII